MKLDPTAETKRFLSARREFVDAFANEPSDLNPPPRWATVHGYRRQGSTIIVYCNPEGAWISRVTITPRRTP